MPLIYLLPVPVMVGLSTALFAAPISWSAWYVARAGRRSADPERTS